MSNARWYKERFGDCNVPTTWEENPKLAIWVSKQRQRQRDGTLSVDRKARLDELGLEWAPLDANWETMFAKLKRYKDEHGHCNVGRADGNRKLALWVTHQRVSKNKGKLSSAYETRLDGLGFVWDLLDTAWETMFADLKRYRDEHGHCNVPQCIPQLGPWVAHQCRKKEGRVSAEQKTRLDALGFDWDPHDFTWETMFAELQRYKERFGHCNVPEGWPENPQLAGWVKSQRRPPRVKGRTFLPRTRKKNLSEEKKNRLKALGFVEDPRESAWETMFAELQRYKERFGHCNVPQRWPDSPRLGSWVAHQHALRKTGKLLSARKARLDALGFVGMQASAVPPQSDSRSVLWRAGCAQACYPHLLPHTLPSEELVEATAPNRLLISLHFPRPPRLRVHVIGDQQHREQNAGEEAGEHAEPNR